MAATPVAVLSFLGFDGISTLAEDAKNPKRDIGRATILVCFIAGGLFILQTYLGQLIWPKYSTFNPVETAFSDIGRQIGGPALAYLIALLVIAQAWASGITSQASASRLLFAMATRWKVAKRRLWLCAPQTTNTELQYAPDGRYCHGSGIISGPGQSGGAGQFRRLRRLHGRQLCPLLVVILFNGASAL